MGCDEAEEASAGGRPAFKPSDWLAARPDEAAASYKMKASLRAKTLNSERQTNTEQDNGPLLLKVLG